MATHSSILAWRIPMDRGAWRATIHGVAKSWTGLSEFHVISPQPAVCCVTTGRCCWLTRSSEKPGHHSSPSLLVVRKALRKPVALENCLGFSSLAGKMCPNQPQRPGLGTPCQSLWSVEQRGKEQKPEGGPDDTPWLINWTK